MAKYHHNYRLVEVENADASLKHRNEELVKLPVRNGLQVDPQEVFRERIKSLPYYQSHKIRKMPYMHWKLSQLLVKMNSLILRNGNKKCGMDERYI